MASSKAHAYRGARILPCAWATGEHRGRWYVESVHEGGLPYGDESSAHFATLAEAREAIDQERQEVRR